MSAPFLDSILPRCRFATATVPLAPSRHYRRTAIQWPEPCIGSEVRWRLAVPARYRLLHNWQHQPRLRGSHCGTSVTQQSLCSRSRYSQLIPRSRSKARPAYDDHTGMPLPLEGDTEGLNRRQIESIFGKFESYDGNLVLRVLHYRRVTGSLPDTGTAIRDVPFLKPEQAEAALDYLRREFPVNEEAAHDHWLRNEGKRLEWEIAQRERLKLEGKKHWEYKLQEKPRGDAGNPYGGSALDDLIARSKSRAKDNRDRKAEKRELAQNSEIPRLTDKMDRRLVAMSKSRELTKPKGPPAWVQYYREKAVLSTDKEPPKMTTFQRLWPSFIVALVTLGGCIVLAQEYVPPSPDARLWASLPPAAATCIAIIGLNFAVYVAWWLPPCWRLLNTYFLIVPGFPRALGIVGSAWSHQGISHLALNMAMVWILGPSLHDEVGRGAFLAIYIACGTIGQFTSLAIQVMRRSFDIYGHGASGATMGLLAANCIEEANRDLRIPFTDISYPVNKKILLLVLTLYEVFQLFRGGLRRTAIDHYAHLGGLATGAMGVAAYQSWRKSLDLSFVGNAGEEDEISVSKSPDE